jgi:hypothetical protein
MGCWNGTCGLSGLPIIHGEEMYVFPILESYRDSFCYATALYRPSVVPFRAEYNDYGAGENCSGPALEFLIAGIRENLIEMEVGENKYHDIAVKREGFDVDMFFETCHEKRLRMNNPLKSYPGQKEYREMFFTMIRKDVVDRLWNEWSFDMWKGSDGDVPEGFEGDKYYIKNVTYAKLAELIPHYMEQMAGKDSPYKKALEGIDDESKLLMKEYFGRYAFFEGYREHILSGYFGHAFGSSYASGGFTSIGNIKDKILDEYFDGDKEVAYELMREALVGIMINSFMESTRKIWLPSMHQGSQSECYDEYRLMNKITTDIMNAREKQYDCDEE